ncbi:MAG TPA: ribosomal-processing cysteine protease Prp [Candidatus Deferrimicrobium sp.]|nr:ribosomal-processing cysteine protease Prp [Candidatus Deferrimicrobium sp.]
MSSNTKPRKIIAVNKDTVNHTPKSLLKASKPKRVVITTYLDEQKDIRSFRVEGHAGYAVSGNDIVCAAISTLTICAVNGLEQYLSSPPQSEVKDGFLECTVPQLQSETDRLSARVILGTMMLGLEQIRMTYGSKYIDFEQRRWTPCYN